MQRTLIASVVVIAAGCGSSAPTDVTVDELGVVISVPGNWSRKDRGGGDVGFVSGFDGVILSKESHVVKTIDDARGALIMGAKIREEKTLPTGGFFFAFDEDFGTPKKPMVLPEIEVLLPTPGGTVSCKLQLQPDQDAAPIAKACSSMRAK